MKKLPRISYLEYKTNDLVNLFVGPQELLLANVKRRKLAWSGHVTRHDSLSKTILQGSLEGGRHHGRQRKCWMDITKKRTYLTMPECSQGLPAEKTGRGALLNCSHTRAPHPTPPNNPVSQGTELNCYVPVRSFNLIVSVLMLRELSCKW